MINEQYFLSKSYVDPVTGCWLWQRAKAGSYGSMGYKGKHNMRVHRAAYIELVGEIPENLHVLHSCNNSLCCNPAHLRLGTQAENILDRTKAERGHTTKLTAAQVLEIRASNLPQAALARKYGVTHVTINKIVHRHSWVHI